MSFTGLELQIREYVSKAWDYVYNALPYAGLYRPVSEVIGISPGIVVFLYGNPKVTKDFILRYTQSFFNPENQLIAVGYLPELDEATKSKVNLIVLDEVYDDQATANRIYEFRQKRKDLNRIVFIRPAEGSVIDKLSKVGCETTYASDFFIPFPRRSPPVQGITKEPEVRASTDALLYIRQTIIPKINIDRRRIRAVRKIFDYLSKLTGKYFRKEPKFDEGAFVRVMKTFKRYRNKEVPTIQDIIAIVPLMMAPKMLVTASVVKRRLKRSYYYVKKIFGEVDLDMMKDEEILKLAEIGGIVIFDVLRFAEGIIRYILSE